MRLDVAALQYLYGVNPSGSTATGDVAGAGGRFVFSGTQPVMQTLYSATGRDVIDLTGLSRRSLVNLNAGSCSSINMPGVPLSGGFKGFENVAIAHASRIHRVVLSTDSHRDAVVLNGAFREGGFNEIDNFKPQDTIVLSKSVFGRLSSRKIGIGGSDEARHRCSRIVLNQGTGEVFFDADGAGRRHAAVKVAMYQAVQGTTVGAANFSVMA